MKLSSLQKLGWDLTIDIGKRHIGKYGDWNLYLDIAEAKIFTASDGLQRTIKGSSLREVRQKIENKRKSDEMFRARCKDTLTDTRKCEYCYHRFACFTEGK